jgi:diguanylate cyclase (GGDEF)-like protein
MLRRRVSFQTAELRRAKESAEAAAHAVSEAYDRMEFDATHDGMTGLLNRHAVLQRLDAEISRSSRENVSLSVLLIDVDHFKRVNDSFGHMAGDEVLREVAQRMSHSLRAYDHIGRYGGEEFLVILPGATSSYAREVAERLRCSIVGNPVQHEAGDIRVTISIGFVTAPQVVVLDDTRILSTADAALYKAKEHGRNRVEAATSQSKARSDATTTKGRVGSSPVTKSR